MRFRCCESMLITHSFSLFQSCLKRSSPVFVSFLQNPLRTKNDLTSKPTHYESPQLLEFPLWICVLLCSMGLVIKGFLPFLELQGSKKTPRIQPLPHRGRIFLYAVYLSRLTASLPSSARSSHLDPAFRCIYLHAFAACASSVLETALHARILSSLFHLAIPICQLR